MAVVVKLVNTLDCGSSISWVRVPSIALSNQEPYICTVLFFVHAEKELALFLIYFI